MGSCGVGGAGSRGVWHIMDSCGVGGAGSRVCGVSWVAVGWEGQDLGGVAYHG